jgi:hypothetical protein
LTLQISVEKILEIDQSEAGLPMATMFAINGSE